MTHQAATSSAWMTQPTTSNASAGYRDVLTGAPVMHWTEIAWTMPNTTDTHAATIPPSATYRPDFVIVESVIIVANDKSERTRASRP